MNGINLELLNKINKLDKVEGELLLELINMLSQTKTYSEKREVQQNFRSAVNKIINQQE